MLVKNLDRHQHQQPDDDDDSDNDSDDDSDDGSPDRWSQIGAKDLDG